MQRTGNEKTGNSLIEVPVKAGEILYECTMAAIDSYGYAVTASKTEGLIIAGCVQRFTNNSSGENGAVNAKVKRGTFVWDNDGSIKSTDLLKPCYISGATSVTITAEGSSPAGIILAVEPDGVTVDMTARV